MSETLALNFFLRLLLGHLIGDFTLQPLWLAIAKRTGWLGLLLHVMVVTFVTAVMIWQIIPNWFGWTVVLFIIHLFIDQFRTFIFTDNTEGKGFLLLILDQIAHVLSVMLISWLATGWQFSMLSPDGGLISQNNLIMLSHIHIADGGLIFQNNLIYIFCFIVFAIWVVPILEIELVVALRSYRTINSYKLIPINFSDRIMGASERLIGLVLIAFSWSLLIPLAFLPRLYWLLYRDSMTDRMAAFSKIGTSFATVLIIGFFL